MKILMINHFTQIPGETGNGRFVYIADMFLKAGLEVEMVTTSFSHRTKRQREIKSGYINKLPYQLTMLYEPGYQKNVSFKRFYSHYVFGRSLKKYLKKIEKIDVIYCSVPSLDAGKVAAKYAKKNKIKFIIDIQDLWPEAFKMVFNIPVLSNIIFYPMKKIADYIYSGADEIIAVSDTYANRAKKVNTRVGKVHSVFLGTDLNEFDLYNRNSKKENHIPTLVYIGTLGHSYDLSIIFESIKQIKDSGIDLKMLVMGDGPLMDYFQKRVVKLGIDVEFTGALPYKDMVERLCSCDIAINPIAKGAAQSIINKVGDYAAAGLPVISTQECPEYVALLHNSNSGFTCMNNNVNDISDKIKTLVLDEKKREAMGKNSRQVAEKMFDRSKTYEEILDIVRN